MRAKYIITTIILSLGLSAFADNQSDITSDSKDTKQSTLKAQKTKIAKPETIVVKQVKQSKKSKFQSVIRPVIKGSIVSPVKGNITFVNKVYGDLIKKDEVIINISSNQAKKQLMSNVVDYIQSKDSYQEALATVRKNIELQKKGVISKQELTDSESSYISSLINMVRTRIEFRKISESLDFDWKRVDNIDLSNRPMLQKKGGAEDLVEFLLNKEYIVKIESNSDGIFLPKITQDDDQEHIDFNPGGKIKEDQTIGMIANPNKLKLMIDVPEFEVMKVKKGQPAVMTIPVLDNKKMDGYVAEVRRFEYKSRSGQLPTIPVQVEIACKENCASYYSISAEITLTNPPETTLQVPLSAVKKVYDDDDNEVYYIMKIIKNEPVKTKVTVGETSKEMIVIKSGVKKGDEVVKNYKNTKT